MPGGWLGGKYDSGGKRRQERYNRGAMRSGVAERGPDSTVAKDLAGSAVALLGANRLGSPVGLAYACCRSRESQ